MDNPPDRVFVSTNCWSRFRNVFENERKWEEENKPDLKILQNTSDKSLRPFFSPHSRSVENFVLNLSDFEADIL